MRLQTITHNSTYKMKKILLFLPAFLFLSFASFAQHAEIGLLLGGSVYQGDLSPTNKLQNFRETNMAVGAFYRYNINDFVGARLGFTFGTISGTDAKDDSESRRLRNLSFQSNIFELALTAEFNILGFQPYNLERVFSPYIFVGVAVFRHNPKAEYQGDLYALQPLGTEGQGLPQFPEKSQYGLTQISFPIGGGLKYAFNDTWSIGAELGFRMTITDYLDDVSTEYISDSEILEARGEVAAALANRTGQPVNTGATRGSSENQDWYIIGGITVSYNLLDNGLVGFRRKNSRKTGCPTF